MPQPRKIIIDTDPGQDDAVAILLALASNLDVLALTTVAGNVSVDKTTHNALQIRDLAGRPDLPVYAGADRPLARALTTAEEVHGASGLEGLTLPAPSAPKETLHAVDYLIETLLRCDDITLCALGPLTNIATALTRAPQIAPRIREIVLMGGSCFEGGNVTPAAEFNIFVDPEAARIVFGAGVPLTIAPLDVTHQLLTQADWIDGVEAMGRVGAVAASWLRHYERYDAAKYGARGAPLHDPAVIAYLIDPTLFSGKKVNIEVECESALTRGLTLADWWGVSGRAPNATVLNKADAAGVFALLSQAIARYA